MSASRLEIISFENLTLEVQGRAYLRDADLAIYEGESLIVAGLPGCGKSFILRAILGLPGDNLEDVRLEGDLTIDGQSVLEMSHEELQQLRRRMGTVMGSVMNPGGLIDNMDVSGNIALPLNYHNRGIMSLEEIEGRCEVLLRDMDMVELGIPGLRPVALNREQRLYVSLARCLVNEPIALLMDDPASGLSPGNAHRLKGFLFDYQPEFATYPSHEARSERALTRVVTTSDLSQYLDVGDRFAVISDGKVRVVGDHEDVAASTDEEVLELLSPDVRANALSVAEESATELTGKSSGVGDLSPQEAS